MIVQFIGILFLLENIGALPVTDHSRDSESLGSYQYSSALVGEIKLYAGSSLFLPYSWILCHGQAISRVGYQQLFSVIGESFGAGDGKYTFNVPDFRGRFPLGHDATQTQMNEFIKSGSSTKTLTLDQMPKHQHRQGSLRATDAGGHSHGIHDPGHNHGGSTEGAHGGSGSHNLQRKNSGRFDDQGWHQHVIPTGRTGISIEWNGVHSHSINGATDDTGNGQPFDIMPPYQSIHYVIFAGDYRAKQSFNP